MTKPEGGGSEQRTRLAADRTYASWLRTGVAFLASGLAAQRLLHDVLPSVQLRMLATVLILCAVAAFGAAWWRDATMRGPLPKPDIALLPRALTAGLAMLLVLVSPPAADDQVVMVVRAGTRPGPVTPGACRAGNRTRWAAGRQPAQSS